MGKIRDAVRRNPDRAQELMDKMKSGMDQLASKIVHGRSTEKYTSINVKNGYIEFRSPGGDWLNDNFAEIENTLRRFTVALSAAVDPEAYREEYLKKLYKLLDVSGEKDPLSYFAKYAAGELPRAALKSFVRQAQAERKVKSGKADAEEYDKLAAIHQELGLEPPQRAAGASTTASHPEGRGSDHMIPQDVMPLWHEVIKQPMDALAVRHPPINLDSTCRILKIKGTDVMYYRPGPQEIQWILLTT
jgi:hypothetical protein